MRRHTSLFACKIGEYRRNSSIHWTQGFSKESSDTALLAVPLQYRKLAHVMVLCKKLIMVTPGKTRNVPINHSGLNLTRILVSILVKSCITTY